MKKFFVCASAVGVVALSLLMSAPAKADEASVWVKGELVKIMPDPTDPPLRVTDQTGTGSGGILVSALSVTAIADASCDGAGQSGSAHFGDTVTWKQKFVLRSDGSGTRASGVDVPWTTQAHGSASVSSSILESTSDFSDPDASASSSVATGKGGSAHAFKSADASTWSPSYPAPPESNSSSGYFNLPDDLVVTELSKLITVKADASANAPRSRIYSSSASASGDASATIGQPVIR